MKDGKYIDEIGNEYWFKDDRFHRNAGPAITYTVGLQYWSQNGKRHRDNGPAVTHIDGSKEWYRNGISLTESEILILKEKISFDVMMKDLLSSGDSV